MTITRRQWMLAVIVAVCLHLFAAVSVWVARPSGAPKHAKPQGVMVSLDQFKAGPPATANAPAAPSAAQSPAAAAASAPAPAAAQSPAAAAASAPAPETAGDIGPRPAKNPSATRVAPPAQAPNSESAETAAPTANSPEIASARTIGPDSEAEPLKPQIEVTARQVNPSSNSTRTQADSNGAYGNSKQATDNYIVRLQAWLSRHKQYPQPARQKNITGTVRLYIVIDRSGRVVEHRIQGSSGSKILDQAAEQMLARAKPLPNFSGAMQRNRLELVVPVKFTLH